MGVVMSIFETIFDATANARYAFGDFVEEAIDVVCENPKTSAAIAVGIVTGGVGAAILPAIGAAVSGLGFGVAGGTLSGAAASSAGLAALGGGSLASGGLGMAGGAAVATAASTGAGAAVGAGVTKALS